MAEVLSGFVYASAPTPLDPAALAEMRWLLALDVSLGAAMLVAAWYVTRQPVRVAVSLLCAWGVAQLLILVVSPLLFVTGIIGRIIMTAGLLRGLSSARRAEALRRELATAEP